MTGPEHYAEAERLLALALHHQATGNIPRAVDICHAQAQVHATLALTAATQEVAVATREVGDQMDTLPRAHHIAAALNGGAITGRKDR